MSIASDLNRATRIGHKKAIGGKHLVGSFIPTPGPTVYTARCYRGHCDAVVGITSLMDVVGDGTFTVCQGNDPYSNQMDAIVSAEGMGDGTDSD